MNHYSNSNSREQVNTNGVVVMVTVFAMYDGEGHD